MRLLAGTVLQEIFDHMYAELPDFPHKKLFQSVFNQETIKEVVRKDQVKIDQSFQKEVIQAELTYFILENLEKENQKEFIYYWNQAAGVYSIVVPLLDLPEYSYHILKGLCVSVGGITESVIKYSLNAMTEYIAATSKKETKDQLLTQLFDNSIKLLKDYAKDERIITPLFKTLDFIFEKQEIQCWGKSKIYARQIYDLIVSETKSTKSIMKLTASVGLIVGLINLQCGDTTILLLRLVAQYLVHKFPKVRKLMADKFYLLLLSSGEQYFGEEVNDACIEYLLSVDWLEMEKFNYQEPAKKFNQLFKLGFDTDEDQSKK